MGNIFKISQPDINEQLLSLINFEKENGNNEQQCVTILSKSYVVKKKECENGLIILCYTDITIMHEINQLKHESMIKANLMQTLRHEIRTPLSGIIGMICSLKTTLKPILNEDSKKLISVAIYSCNMISNLLNNFSSFTDFESSSVIIEERSFNIRKFLSSISKLATFQTELKNIHFKLIEQNLPKY